MIVGSTILHDGTGTTAYYTPSFRRGGEAALFSIDVTHETGSPTMVVTVEHKNEDETAWTAADTFSSITATGVASKDVSDLKEQVRLAFTFTAGSAGDSFHVVMAPPAWRPY